MNALEVEPVFRAVADLLDTRAGDPPSAEPTR
jgi:hypothetical protein